MEEGGWVGSVGGVKQKLLGAEADGVDLFFLPADYDWLGEDGNEAEARRVKQEYGLSLQIVPVESLTEAIKYLQEQDKGGLRIHDTN
jgi:PDZ domain-containing protein